MKPLKGYKDVTDWILTRKCQWPECTRDADIPMDYHEGTGTWSNWMCTEHAIKQLNKERREDHSDLDV